MEYLDGIDLDQLVQAGRRRSRRAASCTSCARCAARWPRRTTSASSTATSSPANIILCERGGMPDVAKVVDFGLVKALPGRGHGRSRWRRRPRRRCSGTPLYMAPETRSAARELDARSDLYALGAVGYLLLTGTPVFQGESVVEIWRIISTRRRSRRRADWAAPCRPSSSSWSCGASRRIPTNGRPARASSAITSGGCRASTSGRTMTRRGGGCSTAAEPAARRRRSRPAPSSPTVVAALELHLVPQRLAASVAAEVVDEDGDDVSGKAGRGGVAGDEHARRAPQRVGRWQRLFLEDVEDGGGEAFLLECLDQRAVSSVSPRPALTTTA